LHGSTWAHNCDASSGILIAGLYRQLAGDLALDTSDISENLFHLVWKGRQVRSNAWKPRDPRGVSPFLGDAQQLWFHIGLVVWMDAFALIGSSSCEFDFVWMSFALHNLLCAYLALEVLLLLRCSMSFYIVGILLTPVGQQWLCSGMLCWKMAPLGRTEGTFEINGSSASACGFLDLGTSIVSSCIFRHFIYSLLGMICSSLVLRLVCFVFNWFVLLDGPVVFQFCFRRHLIHHELHMVQSGSWYPSVLVQLFSMTATSNGMHSDDLVDHRPRVLVSSFYEAAYVSTCTVPRVSLASLRRCGF